MRFRVLYTSEHLPEEARKVLVKAHGGFAVDHRPGRGETYFALPGVGILEISADLRSIRMLNTPDPMKNVNSYASGPCSFHILVPLGKFGARPVS